MEKTSPNVKALSTKDFDSICRLCLRRDPMGSIFDLKYEELSFADILFELFSTQVYTEDELPKNICETCISEITRFCNFRKSMSTSEQILQSIVAKELNEKMHEPINLCEDLIEIKDEPELINLDSSDEDQFQAGSIVTNDINTVGDFFIIRDHAENLQAVYVLETMAKHNENDDNAHDKSKSEQTYYCQFCQGSFYQPVINTHLSSYNAREFMCSYCGKCFCTEENLNEHLEWYTFKNACSLCYRTFSERRSLISHTFTHAGNKPYECKVCSKPFTQRHHLLTHLRTHTEQELQKFQNET